MDMRPVASSNLSAVGYDEDNLKLRVTFRSGKTWEYNGVERETYTALMNAGSIGSAFHRMIRDQYPGIPVT